MTTGKEISDRLELTHLEPDPQRTDWAEHRAEIDGLMRRLLNEVLAAGPVSACAGDRAWALTLGPRPD